MSAPPDDIPVLGGRVAGVGSALHFAPGGHAANALVHVIGQLPCDLLFEMDEPCLRDIATTAMSLVDRPRPRAKTVRDTLRRFTNVLVWLPDRKSKRLNSSLYCDARIPSSATKTK